MSGPTYKPSRAKLTRKAARLAQDYEEKPPTCVTCVHFDPAVHASKPSDLPMRPFKPSWCTLGDFGCKPSAVCNSWRNKRGETIES